jgi:protein O-GlcNAc transferase
MAKPRKTARPVAPLAPLRLQARPSVGPLLLVEAQQLLVAGEHDKAGRLLQMALGHADLNPEASNLLAISALMREQVADALPHARQAVAARPGDARYQFTLGRALKALGDLAAAEASYRQALALSPRYVEAMVSLGIVLKNQERIDEAIDLYEAALRLQPRMVSAFANLSNALALRAAKKAEETFDERPDEDSLNAVGRAVALDLKNATLHRNYGVLLERAGRHREAIEAFNEVLTLEPDNLEVCLRLGAALMAFGAKGLAREAYEKWLDKNAPSAPVMRALAEALTRDGLVDEALGWSEKALALDRDPDTVESLGRTLMQSRRLEESLALCRESIDMSGRRPERYSTFLLGLNYLHEDPQTIAAVHSEYGSLLPPPRPRAAWRPRPERLRVGYVSGDFVRHSVSYFMGGLLEFADRQRFEVYCYHNNVRADDVTEVLKTQAEHWVECHGMSDDGLRRRIEADGIDVLIDLSGHTAGSRILLFAQRAAPVQVAYLGYPTVSGVPAMDFRISDTVIDPGDQPVLAHDLPLALPRSMFCYSPSVHTPLAPPPVLQRGHITFGSFNNIAKLTDHTLALWAAAMNAVPGSRLLLKATSMAQASNRRSIEVFMAARGIAAERLDLVAWVADKDGHLSLYNEVDIALDTFPYNGATTTCEALWMGVPVVSRRGATHTSRMGASLLHAIGRTEWLADDDEGFARIAASLAADPDGLARWRADSRAYLHASELFDARGFARAFEAALDEAWARRRVEVAPSAQAEQA